MEGPPGAALHLCSAADSLQAAQHLLLAGVAAVLGQGGLQDADITILGLADDEGGVAWQGHPV